MVITASKVAWERIPAGLARPFRARCGLSFIGQTLTLLALLVGPSQAWQGGLRGREEMGSDICRGRARNRVVGDVGPGITLPVGRESSRC